MILLTDAGSTSSTHIYLQNGKEIKRLVTGPINPFHNSFEEIIEILKEVHDDSIIPKQVFFFGAGCKGTAQIDKMQKALSQSFGEAVISIESDLMGASIACYGHNSGLIGILGTGSVLAYYNGKDLEDTCFASGYLFGDECSGYHLSRQFLSDYFKSNLPESLTLAFAERHNKNKSELLTSIYQSPNVKTKVASFTPFLGEYKQSEYVINLVAKSFDSFLAQRHKIESKNSNISLVGSVAWNFKDLFLESINKHNLQLEVILNDPIEGLIDFYSKK